MKPKQIWISVIIFFTLILIPTFLWMRDYNFSIWRKIDGPALNNYFSALSIIVSFSSLLIGFVLLNVAIKAAKNFDVKKQFHNKQFEQVCQLAQEILDTKIIIGYYQKNEKNTNYGYNKTGYEITFYSLSDFLKVRQIDTIYIDNDIDEILPFLRYRYNPLIPKAVSAALLKLENSNSNGEVLIDVPDEILDKIDFSEFLGKRPNNYLVLSLFKADAPVIDDVFSKIYFKKSSELQNVAENIRLSLLNWFKVYGADDINI